MSRWTSSQKNFTSKYTFLWSFIRYIRSIDNYFWADLSKTESKGREEHLQAKTKKKIFILEKWVHHLFRKLSEIFSAFRQKPSAGLSKLHSTCPAKTLDIFLWINSTSSIIFRPWAKTFWTLTKFFRLVLEICILRVQRKLLRKTRRMFFFEIKSLSSFSDNEIKFFGFLTKDFRQD